MIFWKNSITNKGYDWFKTKLDDNFHIPNNDKSKVIFGFNGVGKTTMFNCIKDLRNSSIEYLEYTDLKNQLYKDKNVLIISTEIIKIEEIKEKIATLWSKLDVKKNLKENFKIGSEKAAKEFDEKIQTAQKTGVFDGFSRKKSDIQSIEEKLNGINPGLFISLLGDLKNVETAKKELNKAKDHLLFHALNSLDNIVTSTDSICPICGNLADNLKQKIQSKMNELSNIESILIQKLKDTNASTSAETIENLIDTKKLIDSDPNFIVDYVLCNGSSTRYDELNNSLIQIRELETELEKFLEKAEKNYQNIISRKDLLEADLNKYFEVSKSDIKYEATDFRITVKFPRNLNTYSTGEMNLISFLYRVYSFIGSDKDILLLDDPASSLDLINHYKIAYEIVRNSKDKKMIILTHSVELINVLNSQHPGNSKFEYYYLEESNSQISIKEILNSSSKSNPNIISLDKLSDTKKFRGFLNALNKKEMEPENSEIQSLFHFSKVAIYLDNDPQKFSNYDLIALIEDFESFNQDDFYKDSYLKIKYLCALRIWLEKKLYSLIPSTNQKLQEKYMEKDTLNKRINCIFNSEIKLPMGLTKDIIMSKKVMLNQGGTLL